MWSQSVKAAQKFPTPLVSILGPALGGAFLIADPWIGTILWLAVFQDVNHAAFALLGIALAEMIARSCRITDASPVDGSIKANAVLSAIAAAWLTHSFVPVEVQIAIAATCAVMAAMMTAAIIKALTPRALPTMTFGYCIIATMLFAIFPDWTYQASAAMTWGPVPVDLLGWVRHFFSSLGSLLFKPTPEVGVILVFAIMLWSRSALLAGIIGWIAGVATATGLVKLGVVYYWMPTAYNFFLAGMGLGAAFLLPGRASLVIAAIGGCGAAVIAVALQHLSPYAAYGYLPVSSILIVWIGIYALQQASEQKLFRRNRITNLPPEEVWWSDAYWARRSGHGEPFLTVPVEGPVQITQGDDGQLSHVGPWRHALDLQFLPGGVSDGTVEGTSIWGAAVTAPAAGRIEHLENAVPDNPLGICNYANNWGNYVTIRLEQGGWAMLAHLQQHSIAVPSGMRVDIGTYIGKVGNSGRSPVPHLHVQVQGTSQLGSPTIPFRLANYLSSNDPERPLSRWNSASLPEQGTIIAPARIDPRIRALLGSLSPGTVIWTTESTGRIPRKHWRTRSAATLRTTVLLDEAGQHIYRAGTGALTASLGADAWRIIEVKGAATPLLTLLALAIPSIPYAATPRMTWAEPAPIVPHPVARWLGLSLSPYLKEPFAYMRSQCVSVPNDEKEALTIETYLETSSAWLPSKLICVFERLRGPIRLEAVFDHGTLTYTQLSFEPGLPFEHSAK